MSFWAVIFIVLMLMWLFGGCYLSWNPAAPHALGNTLLPWACVAILGYIVLTGQAAAFVVR